MADILKNLKTTIENCNPNEVPAWIHRYYRKLSLYSVHEAKTKTNGQKKEKDYLLDPHAIIVEKPKLLVPIIAPYTLRTLKPFILIDRETMPPRLQLLSDICQRQGRQYQKHAIQYKYIESRHVKEINRLCHIHFWPGIDVSESLEFPEFSVVVEYRRLVIGFGLLVPDVNHTDAYISFLFTMPDWRRAGIAKYMLYHLINTCQGKDITLHVSASNHQALLLYQRFSFKPEQFIQNFYEKHISVHSNECKHAFFLRLNK